MTGRVAWSLAAIKLKATEFSVLEYFMMNHDVVTVTGDFERQRDSDRE